MAHRHSRTMRGTTGVTIDDVRDLLPPLPEGVDKRAYGSVFKGGEFTCIGYRKSTRRECNGRPIGIFVLKD